MSFIIINKTTNYEDIENALLNGKPVNEEKLKSYIIDLQKKVEIAEKENDLVKRFAKTKVPKEKLAIMEEAHKYSLCQTIYTSGRCHLCKGSRCMECISDGPCFECYTNYCQGQSQNYRELLKDAQEYDCGNLLGCFSCEICLTKLIEELETAYEFHSKGLCNCKIYRHKKMKN